MGLLHFMGLSPESRILRELAARAGAGGLLSRSERTRVRTTLYLALMLDQIRRAGDVNCIAYSQATKVVEKTKRVGCPNNPQYTILVLGAKTTSSGKLTPMNIPRPYSSSSVIIWNSFGRNFGPLPHRLI